MQSTPAILLRKRKFSDTSLIVSWCTESLGCIQTIAKGASPRSVCRKTGFVFRSRDRHCTEPEVESPYPLTEVALRNPFAGIRQNYLRTQTAAYFVELIEICTERDHHEPELFGLLRRAFGYLDANQPNLRAVSHFETELAQIGRARRENVEKQSGFCIGEFVREITAVPHAAAQNTNVGNK